MTVAENKKPNCTSCCFFDRRCCAKNPPTVVAVEIEPDNYDALPYTTVWPQVTEDDWCGEYKENDSR